MTRRGCALITSLIVMSPMSAPVHAAPPVTACAAGTTAQTINYVEKQTTTGTTTYTVPNADYVFTVCRQDASPHTYHVGVASTSENPELSAADAQSRFRIVFTPAVGDTLYTVTGQGQVVDFSAITGGARQITLAPVAVSDVAACSNSSTALTCAATATSVIDYGQIIAVSIHSDSAYAPLVGASWMASTYSSQLSLNCPVGSGSVSDQGVTWELAVPTTAQDGTTQVVAASHVALPPAVTRGCWGIDSESFARNAVVFLNSGSGALPAVRDVAPNAAGEYTASAETEDCTIACLSMPHVTGPNATYTVAYAYYNGSAKVILRGFLKTTAGKALRVRQSALSNVSVRLAPGSSAACAQIGNSVVALRPSAPGSNVVCKYKLTFFRKVNGKLKGKKVAGAFVSPRLP